MSSQNSDDGIQPLVGDEQEKVMSVAKQPLAFFQGVSAIMRKVISQAIIKDVKDAMHQVGFEFKLGPIYPVLLLQIHMCFAEAGF